MKLEKNETTFKRLRNFNLLMAAFHFVQFILMLILSNDFKLPITTSFLEWDSVTRVTYTVTEEVAKLQIGPAVASFLLVSSLAHLLIATVGYSWYKKNLRKDMNLTRWYEYSISASIMIVVIGLLSGIYDLPSLVMLFALNASMIFFGYVMEVYNSNQENTEWAAFWFGCFAGAVPWIVIGMYFLGATSDTGKAIPDFVYAILVSLFLFFNIFAINMYLQYKKIGPWKNYLFGEYVYIILSLVAKSALAWQVFSGTLR